jgi:hypothetical protein
VRDDPEAEDGRGLRLVSAVATRWGWNRHDGGATTWAHIDFSR